MMVVGDLDDVFVPMADGLFANPARARCALRVSLLRVSVSKWALVLVLV